MTKEEFLNKLRKELSIYKNNRKKIFSRFFRKNYSQC